MLVKLEFSRQSFQEYTKIKFHGNSSSENRVIACRLTDGQTDISKLIVTFRDFANASKTDRTRWFSTDAASTRDLITQISYIFTGVFNFK